MRAHDFHLNLDDVAGPTLGRRIVLAIQRAITEGRILPGTALPGSRALADSLGVNRLTVIGALQELEAEGWVVTEPNRGTFVARDLPSLPRTGNPAPRKEPQQVGFDLPSFLRPVSITPSEALLLADGAADPRLAPAEDLAKAYQRALRRHGPRLLQDRDPMGTPLLREAVASWLSERHGLKVSADRILITRGSRGALALVASTLFRAGECVAVENPGNKSAWEILRRSARMELRPVPVDAGGMDPGALQDLLKKDAIRLLYLTPRRHYPTNASMPRNRALEILRLAAEHRVAVLEDDYDGEIAYTDHRPEPLLALDRTGQVIHIGSLSRLLAPGLRLGYLVVPTALAPYLARTQPDREEQGDPAFEWAVADLIRDGILASHLRRTRKTYQARRDFLASRLQERLGTHLDVAVPDGGMALWLKIRGVDPDAWLKATRQKGLILNPPSHFYLDHPVPAFRMGFAQADETELWEAVTRLEFALAALQRG